MKSKKRVWLIPLMLVAVVAIILLVSTRRLKRATNYDDPAAPLFMGEFATPAGEVKANVVVVSYNIQFAEKIEEAIAELKSISPLFEADVLLLQEMDELGTVTIAKALNYNYVYFPAAVHAQSGRDFGTAVLARWPLSDPVKLILPHSSINSGMIRIATKATAQINGMPVDLYSAHTETIAALPWHRTNQFASLAEDTARDSDDPNRCIIVGGDFNTVFDREIVWLTEAFDGAGLVHASADVGPTVSRFGIDAAADHIFIRGFQVVESGIAEGTTASDHNAIWVKLTSDC